MQKINEKILRERAKALLADGTVDRVLGWKRGDFDWDVTPGVMTADTLDEFVWGDFSAPNLSKYLVSETRKDGKILVFLKPCDTYSFNQLLTEHRFDREKVYAIALPCEGMIDNKKLAKFEGIRSVEAGEDTVILHTLYDGDITVPRAEMLAERCKNCKSKKCVAYDELLSENGEVMDSARFDEVEKIEAMSADERFAFWQNELSKCIRCNACRDVCPACTCEKCVFDNPASGIESKAPSDSFEEKMFHIIRAFHVAGRCTDCGECSRVCPQGIPLHLLNRKFIKDMNGFWGDYQAGETVGSRAPLVDFTLDDMEAHERGGENA
ncbi:MAG: 4Fe-4S ferredoxin [Ruminococcaceae bacterium]|nr:4Fe-4S ferredoxin [Oscillospiraceae bacterium]